MSRTTNNRQTISYLTRRFREVGIRPDTKHGQNFLIDLNLIELLVNRAAPGPQDVILEVGTGTGSLTAMFAQTAAAVLTIEIDARMFQLASEELYDFDNVTMMMQDVLKNKNNFAPEVLDKLREILDSVPDGRLKLAANLPYNIATPVISNLLALEDFIPYTMTVTIQKELGDRVTAVPSTKDYGALSIWMQSQCDVELVRVMPPSVFWPRPKVHSAIVHIKTNLEKRARLRDRAYFHRFIRALFFHRRKFLRSVLLSAYKKRMTKPQADDIMSRTGLGPESRAEELSVEKMIELCHVVRETIGD